MRELVWRDPPPPPTPLADLVAKNLKEHPGEWALIEQQSGLRLFPWWAPLYNDEEFEVKIVETTRELFGPRDIYARYKDESDV